jgi:DNA-binding response OmpR family regulator
MKILLVEDDTELAATLAEALVDQNYSVDTATDGEQALARARRESFDLLLLDVMLPRLDGINLCQKLRDDRNNVPILIMTACGSSAEQISGLDAGADDYVLKPVQLPVLLARIRALLRRNSHYPNPNASALNFGNIAINAETGIAYYSNLELTLTRKEFNLLELLVCFGDRIVKREEIVQKVWTKEQNPSDDTIRSHIKSLRQKLKSAGAPEDLIETVHGRGFRLNGIYGGM